ncbi:tetratricopeptide repeat protein, partial [Nocardia tengchongensis]
MVDARGASIGAIGDHATQLNYFSVTVVARADRFWTEPLSSPPLPPVEQLDHLGISALLGAHFQVVPYTGRLQERADLARWRDAKSPRAVRLLHGPGGSGKTRLAMQFAYESQAAGWAVAIAHPHSEPATAVLADTVSARGLLLLVDYAERWRREDLESVIRDFVFKQSGVVPEQPIPVRVLLLARPSGGWWDSFVHPLTKLGFVVDERILTEPDVVDRQALFDAARDRFAEMLNVADPHRLSPTGSLADPGYELTLTVQMAALSVVDAAARGIDPPDSPADLSGYLINREISHWATMFDNHRIATPPQQMARIVAVAALTATVTYEQASEILTRAGLTNPDQNVDDHRLCYPPLLSGTALQPMLPDRLAEDFLARIVPKPTAPSSGDPWTARLPERLLPVPDPTEPMVVADYKRHAVIVLIEAAHRAGHITTTVLNPLLLARPVLAVAAGGAALLRLTTLLDLDIATLSAVDAALPDTRHTDLDAAAAAISTTLLPALLAGNDDPAEHAQIHEYHAWRLVNAGQYGEALTAIEKAVDVYRQLVADDPAHLPALALALNNLGIRLSQARKREEALIPSEEAVAVCRQLAVDDPAHLPALALALNNLGIRLSEAGRREEALSPTN